MISYHKLGTLTYHTFFKVMISHHKRVAVLPSSFSAFLSFSFSLGVGPSFSGVLKFCVVEVHVNHLPRKSFSTSYFT